MKYTDDTTIIGHISNNNENSYREKINSPAGWDTENNLLPNIMKTKGLIVDFRKQEANTLIRPEKKYQLRAECRLMNIFY